MVLNCHSSKSLSVGENQELVICFLPKEIKNYCLLVSGDLIHICKGLGIKCNKKKMKIFWQDSYRSRLFPDIITRKKIQFPRHIS